MATSANLYSVIQGLAPLLHYPLTETSGTTLVNAGSLGSGCNLTLTGSYALAVEALIAGDSTAFLKLTGGYATGSRGAMPLPLTNMTLSVVLEIFPSTPLAANPRIFVIQASGETEATNSQANYGLVATTLTPSAFHEGGVGVDDGATPTQTIALAAVTGTGNTLVHYTVTRDAVSKLIRFYYNGGLFHSETYTTNPTGGTSTALWLGTEPDLRPSHPMAMGHLSLWNRVLTQTELTQLHTASGYNTLAQPQTNSATFESIQGLLNASGLKRLRIAYDALIDPGINNPEQVYSET